MRVAQKLDFVGSLTSLDEDLLSVGVSIQDLMECKAWDTKLNRYSDLYRRAVFVGLELTGLVLPGVPRVADSAGSADHGVVRAQILTAFIAPLCNGLSGR